MYLHESDVERYSPDSSKCSLIHLEAETAHPLGEVFRVWIFMLLNLWFFVTLHVWGQMLAQLHHLQ